MKFLKIENTDISKYINKLKPTHEPIWNTKAGRTQTAEFVGRIVAWKWKLEFTTKPLSQDDIVAIMSLIEKKPFFSVEFIPTNSKSKITRTFYVNAPTTEVYSYADTLQNVRYTSLAFNVIEK